MKKAEAALLVMLPLGASWYLWHGYPSIAAALMAAALAIILGAFMSGRLDAGRKLKTLGEAAKSDGRYVAQHLEEFMQSDVVDLPGLVPADTRELLESLLSEITHGLSKRSLENTTARLHRRPPLPRSGSRAF